MAQCGHALNQLHLEPDQLANDLRCHESRCDGRQLTFSHDRKRIMLGETETTRDFVGKYEDSCAAIAETKEYKPSSRRPGQSPASRSREKKTFFGMAVARV